MAINPMKLLQFKSIWEQFTNRHPKFPQFMNAVSQHGITEGTVIEVSISTPDGKNFTTNLKVTPEDMDAMRSLQDAQ